MNQITKQTIQKLYMHTDAAHQEFVKKMIPSNKEVLGIKVAQLRIVLKDVKTQIAHYSAREKIELAIEWVKTDVHELGQMGYELIGFDKNLLACVTKEDLNLLNHHLDNWASVDAFSIYLYGRAWKLGILSDIDLVNMVQHQSVWQRRVAIVSTIPLNRKGKGSKPDPERTFMICDYIIEDYEDMVVKALSWALRELSKVDASSVVSYLKMHEEVLHKRVLREVNNKIMFGLKNLK